MTTIGMEIINRTQRSHQDKKIEFAQNIALHSRTSSTTINSMLSQQPMP